MEVRSLFVVAYSQVRLALLMSAIDIPYFNYIDVGEIVYYIPWDRKMAHI